MLPECERGAQLEAQVSDAHEDCNCDAPRMRALRSTASKSKRRLRGLQLRCSHNVSVVLSCERKLATSTRIAIAMHPEFERGAQLRAKVSDVYEDCNCDAPRMRALCSIASSELQNPSKSAFLHAPECERGAQL